MLQNTNGMTYEEVPQTVVVLPNADETFSIGVWTVNGEGDLQIVNTGGSSASEGGTGSSSDTDEAKGDLTSGDKSDADRISDDDGFDPIKRSVEQAEQERKSKQ